MGLEDQAVLLEIPEQPVAGRAVEAGAGEVRAVAKLRAIKPRADDAGADELIAAMKAAGIDPAFAPHCFTILQEGKGLQCAAVCVLSYLRQNRKRGDLYHQ